MGSAMSMCGQKVSPVTNVGCEKAPGHDGPHGVLFGASPVTSPRTPRQVLGWTVPDHIESGTIGRWVNVTCRHGACHGTPESSRTYYVPAMSVAAAPAPFATFLRNHAHGGEVTDTLAPLSEVLPETPEPPQVIKASYTLHEETVDVTQLRARIAELEELCEIGSVNQDVAALRREVEQAREDLEEARGWAKHGYEIGQRTCTWSDQGVAPLWLIESYRPVPASQSVPAVPVSSTGGKETGEAAETATAALNAAGVGSLSEAIGLALNDTYAGLEFEDPTFESGTMAIMAVLRERLAGWRPPLPKMDVDSLRSRVGALIDELAFHDDDRDKAHEVAQALIDGGWLDRSGAFGSPEPVAHTLRRVIQDLENEAMFRDPMPMIGAYSERSPDDVIGARVLSEYAERLRKHPSLAGESLPLPDSETEPDAMQWGYREHVGEDVDPVREEYARFRAQDEHLKLVQREVRYGPWIEVTS